MTTRTAVDAAKSRSSTGVVDRLLEAIAVGSGPPEDRFSPLYSSGATLDAVVPGWRFEASGPDAIAAVYSRWFNYPGVLDELQRQPTPIGEVLEYTVSWEEDGVAHAARHVHVLTFDPEDDVIAEDHVWCGGRWDAALLAEMAAARPGE